jgi:glycosyltransferase involved in cell wall biosynthesis
MNKLPVSVIIITRNAAVTLESCLESIRSNGAAEIIVVDGNSSDNTLEIARRFTERIFSDEGKGKSGARQLGAEVAAQDYLAYVDADIVLAESTLAQMLGDMRRGDYAGVSAHILPPRRKLNYWEWGGGEHNRLSKQRHREGHLATAACILKRDIVIKYKFTTAHHGYIDDVDMETKIKKGGYCLGISSARAYYCSGDNLHGLITHRFFLGRTSAFCVKEYGPWHAGFWPPLATAYWLGYSLVKGRPAMIPFFLVEGLAKTAGMAKGFVELIWE